MKKLLEYIGRKTIGVIMVFLVLVIVVGTVIISVRVSKDFNYKMFYESKVIDTVEKILIEKDLIE